MAKVSGLEKLSYGELGELRNRVDRLMIDKRNAARDELRQKVTVLVKEHGAPPSAERSEHWRMPKVSVSPRLRLISLDACWLRRRRFASPMATSSRAAARRAG